MLEKHENVGLAFSEFRGELNKLQKRVGAVEQSSRRSRFAIAAAGAILFGITLLMTQDGISLKTKTAPAGGLVSRITIAKEVDPATIRFQRSFVVLEQTGAGAGNTGPLRFKELDANPGGNYVAFKAPDSIAADVTWTLPGADGAAGSLLSTNGGTLSWLAVGNAGGSDAAVSGTYNALDVQINSGVISSTELADSLKFVSVQNSAAVEQFAVTDGNSALEFEAGSGIGLTFTPASHRVTNALAALSSDWSQTGAFDIVLDNASSELRILESAGGTFYGTLDVGDLSANQTYTFTTGGTVWTSGNDGSGSGLDADLLDGNSSAFFLDTSASGQTKSGALTVGGLTVSATTSINLNNNQAQLLAIEQGGADPAANLAEGRMFWRTDTNELKVYDSGGSSWVTINVGGGAAPANASYLTLGLHAGLSDERVATSGSGISISDGGANGNATLALSALTADWSQSGAFDIVLNNASSELKILESAGATFFGILDVGDLSADQTYTFTTGGTVWTSGNDGSGTTLDADLLDGISSAGFNQGITAGSGIGVSGALPTQTVALGNLTANWSQGGAFDIVLNNASSELQMLESVGGTFYGTFDVGDLSANQTYTFTIGGTVWTSGNDGSGSTLDADLLDGISSVGFNQGITAGSGIGVSGAMPSQTVALGNLTVNWSQGGAFDIVLNNASSELQILESVGGTFYGTLDVGDLSANQTYTFTTGGTVWTSGNDGSGTGLDADTLDALDSTDFVRATGSVAQTVTGIKSFSSQLNADANLRFHSTTNSMLQTDQGGSIELGGNNTTANSANATPYLDFHFGSGAAQDYNTRIINAANNRLDFATSSGGTVLYINGSKIGVNVSTPGTIGGFSSVRMEIADEDGSNSDYAFRVAGGAGGGGWGVLNIGKTRGTIAAPTIVANGDLIGEMAFLGYDGSSMQMTATIRSYVDATPGASDMPGRLSFFTSADGGVTLTEHIQITNAGLIYLSPISGEVILPDWGLGTPTRTINGSIATAATIFNNRIYWRTDGFNSYVNETGFADYSEYFRTSDATLGIGEVVALNTQNSNAVKRASPRDSSRVIGVVSQYGTRNNDDEKGLRHMDPNYVNVGLLGQLPVLIDAEDGPIVPGDPLTLSAKYRGRAVKAIGNCRIIGYAMTHFPYVEGEVTWSNAVRGGPADKLKADHVMCFLSPGWYEPTESNDEGIAATPVTPAVEPFKQVAPGEHVRTNSRVAKVVDTREERKIKQRK